MANYSIGTATQYDNLPLLPAIGTLNGGIRLNSNISMAVGAKIEFDGLKFNELGYISPDIRVVTDSLGGIAPRFGSYIDFNPSTNLIPTGNSTISPQNNFVKLVFEPKEIGGHTSIANMGSLFVRGAIETGFARAISKQFRVKNSSGAVVYKWLDQISDYKSTPPSASIVGTLSWYKLASDGDEINNYLTPSLFLSAVTTPTEPVVVYILDNSTDVSSIPSTINGQPVTLDYSFSGDKNKSFDFGFSFNF